MCSTPKPKKVITVSNNQHIGAILTSIDTAARLRFAQRANLAQLKREEREEREQPLRTTNKRQNKLLFMAKVVQKDWKHYLLEASFTKFFKKILPL